VEIHASAIVMKGKKYILGFVQDISERKRADKERKKLEQQIQQTQKLESLGVLAGGIAHDFNNLLGGIYGYIDLAKEESEDDNVTEYLSKSLATMNRARHLTQQLLTFSKGGAPVTKVMALFPFIEETVRFALSGSRIASTFAVSEDLCLAEVDSTQLAQVIDNVVINAIQAMPMGGTLAVSAENIVLDGSEYPALSAGSYVLLAFKDTGVGIPSEMLETIFDPFFTTKQMGSGLGLATCYSIIRRHRGHMVAVSEPGKGATFQIYLPAASRQTAESAADTGTTPRGSGRILVMDDEQVIRETTEGMCHSLGYEVTLTTTGQEVIRVFADEKAAGLSFEAIILDLTIPGGIGGREAIEEIRKLDAHVPVFVSSGYADDPIMANPTQYKFTGSLCKPFRLGDLKALFGRHLQR
jgi:nitrogen-specific signal transduction histidine kinase